MPKTRPIIFSPEMVQAIMDGKKTVTRRVIKNPDRYENIRGCGFCCPYGVPGDLLYVRETHWRGYSSTLQPWGEVDAVSTGYIEYLEQRDKPGWRNGGTRVWMRKCPSIHMPRWASRLTLQVKEVRVERLQEITQGDVLAEGVGMPDDGLLTVFDPVQSVEFHKPLRREWVTLWDKINAKRGYGWDANPWVWVVRFEVVNGGDDE